MSLVNAFILTMLKIVIIVKYKTFADSFFKKKLNCLRLNVIRMDCRYEAKGFII